MSRVIEDSAFPSAIREKLQSIRWRGAGLACCRAAAFSLAVLLAAMFVAMMADWWFTIFDTTVRMILTTVSLSLACATLLYFGFRPVVEAFGWMSAAKSVDDEIPQLEERWTTIASFAKSARKPKSKTEKAMLQQVTSEAVAMGALVRPQQVVRPAALKQPITLLTVAALGFTAFLATNWSQTSVLLRRFWQPTAAITATQLESVTGDATVPRGESVELVTMLSGLPRESATFTMESVGAQPEIVQLKPDEDRPGFFVCNVDVDDTFRYRLQAGDGRTEWHTVSAIDYPSLAEVQLTVTAPEYVGQAPIEKTLIPGRLRAIQGSMLSLAMKPHAALTHFELQLESPAEIAEAKDVTAKPEVMKDTIVLKPDADGWYRFETPLLEDFSFSPHFSNEHGLINEDSRVCRIRVVADKAPVARVITPNDEMAVSLDEEIEIKFEAHDDHGIATAELVIYNEAKEGEEPKILAVQEIPLGDQTMQKHVMAKTKLDLKELGLEDGANISYSIRVTDNRMMEIDPDDMRKQLASTEARPGEAPEDRLEGRAESETEEGVGKRVAEVGESPRQEGKTSVDASTLVAGTSNNEEAVDDKSSPTSNDTNNAANTKGDESTDLAVAETAEADSAQRQLMAATDVKTGSGDQTETTASDVIRPVDGSGGENEAADTKDDGKLAADSDVAKSNDAKKAVESAENPGDRKMPAEQETRNDNAAESTAQQGEKSSGKNGAADEKPKSDTAIAVVDGKPAKQGGNQKMPQNDSAENDGKNSSGSSNAPQPKDRRKNDQPKTSMSSPIRQTAQSNDGQRRETSRRRLKVTKRLFAVASAEDERRKQSGKIRDRVVKIDEMLAKVEEGLGLLVNKAAPEAERSDRYRDLDIRLDEIETYIADLRIETQDDKFAFVGLQMVDIGRTHVTPARDRVFVSIRQPDVAADTHAREGLHHVISARELLNDLLKKYDRVVREQNLADKLDEAVTMYEVYVEKTQQLMREARQNRNPLKRKMDVIEVDQSYLDRFAEVLTMRREMMAEFGRILADDPRLLARYMDLIKRRRSSLRNQLTELFDRQDEIAREVSGWQRVQEAQRENLWMLVSEIRLHAAAPLAKDAEAFAERVQKQMPLILDTSRGTAALVIEHAKQVALLSRASSLDAKKAIKALGDADAEVELSANANKVVYELSELAAALDQLNFEGETKEGVSDYVTARQTEARVLADQADAWAEAAGFLETHNYHGLAQVDQQQNAIATELLRVEMLNIETELEDQFGELDMPQEVRNLARELNRVMEAITFNQAAAAFALSKDDINKAADQQERSLAGFETAEELFDKLRRKTVEVLDEREGQNPSAADLQDPTLDEFLARLEREPNIEAQMGIPNRPRNLRVLADTMTWQQNGSGMLGDSGNAAARRAKQEMMAALKRKGAKPKDEQDIDARDMTDEQKKQKAEEKKMLEALQKKMAQTIKELEEKAADENTSAEDQQKLRQKAEAMKRMLQQMNDSENPEDAWDKLAESDEASAMLKALAAGQRLPDSQWNKLMSTLDDGLWQVRTRTPPEDYRRPIEQYQDAIRRLTTIGVEDE